MIIFFYLHSHRISFFNQPNIFYNGDNDGILIRILSAFINRNISIMDHSYKKNLTSSCVIRSIKLWEKMIFFHSYILFSFCLQCQVFSFFFTQKRTIFVFVFTCSWIVFSSCIFCYCPKLCLLAECFSDFYHNFFCPVKATLHLFVFCFMTQKLAKTVLLSETSVIDKCYCVVLSML